MTPDHPTTPATTESRCERCRRARPRYWVQACRSTANLLSCGRCLGSAIRSVGSRDDDSRYAPRNRRELIAPDSQPGAVRVTPYESTL